MNDAHDPNKTLKQPVSPIQFTGETTKVPVDIKLKKILKYFAGALAVTILALAIPFLNLVLIVSMPAAFGLGVYAVYLRYLAVEWAQNKAPDWSQIKVPPPKVEEPEKKDENSGVVFKEH